MILWHIPAKSIKKPSSRPHIYIDNRGRIHFNAAYLNKANSMSFEVLQGENTILFNHDSDKPDLKINKQIRQIYNKPFADWLKSLVGNDIYPDFDIYGSCTIKLVQFKKIQTIRINGTEYSITSLKNYINTLKKRVNESKSSKAKEANKIKYKQVLEKAKAQFPNEFAKY